MGHSAVPSLPDRVPCDRGGALPPAVFGTCSLLYLSLAVKGGEVSDLSKTLPRPVLSRTSSRLFVVLTEGSTDWRNFFYSVLEKRIPTRTSTFSWKRNKVGTRVVGQTDKVAIKGKLGDPGFCAAVLAPPSVLPPLSSGGRWSEGP